MQLIVGALLSGIVLIMLLVFLPPLRSETAAAWVQAFGSIIGLALAVLIMYLQGRQADLAESRSLGRRLDAVAALVERADAEVENMRKHTVGISSFSDYFFSTINVDAIDTITHALRAIPLHEMPSYEIVIGVHEMIIALDHLRPVAIRHGEGDSVHAVFQGDDLAAVKHRARKMSEAKEMILKSIQALGHVSSVSRVTVIR